MCKSDGCFSLLRKRRCSTGIARFIVCVRVVCYSKNENAVVFALTSGSMHNTPGQTHIYANAHALS